MSKNDLVQTREEMANFFFLERIKELDGPKDILEEAEKLIERAKELSKEYPKARPIMMQCVANFRHQLRQYEKNHRTELEKDENSSKHTAAQP